MPKLPDINDLGSRPTPVSRRQIATNPRAGIVGQAVEGLGNTIASIGAQKLEAQDKLDLSAAKAKIYKDSIAAKQALQETDPDYESWGNKYDFAMKASREGAGELIRNHALRAQFDAEAKGDVVRQAADLHADVFARRASAEVDRTRSSLETLLEASKQVKDEQTRTDMLNQIRIGYEGLVAKNYLSADRAGVERRNMVDRFLAGQAEAGLATAKLSFGAAVQSSSDQALSEEHIAKGSAEIARVGKLQHLSDDEIAVLQQKQVSAARRDIAVTIAGSGPEGLVSAQTYLTDHKADFTGDDYLNANSHIQAAVRQQEAAAARAANEHESDLKEQISTLAERAGNGIDVSDDAARLLPQISDTSDIEKLKGYVRDGAYAKVFPSMTPAQRDERIAALSAILPNKRTDDQQAELHWALTHKGALDSAFNNDPVTWAAINTRDKPPPLAQGMAAREQWARRASIAYKRPVPLLSQAEADELADNLPGDEKGVLQTLDAISDPALRARTARQVAPNDPVLPFVSVIQPRQRATIRHGAERLKAEPQFLKPTPDSPEVAERIAEQEARFRLATKEMSPRDQEAVLTVSRQFVAGVLSHTGKNADAQDENTLRIGMTVALGGGFDSNRRWHGGLGLWGDQPFVLPDNQSQGQFSTMAQSYYSKRPDGPAVNPDGSPIPLSRLTPVLISPGKWRWEAGGRVAMDKTGKPLIMEMTRR